MAKTNYNKVEEALTQGMYGLKIDSLLKQADEAQTGKGSQTAPAGELSPRQMMTLITLELKWMEKRDRQIYKTLKLKRKRVEELKQLVSDSKITLRDDELQEIKDLKQQIEMLKKDRFASHTADEQIEQELGRHVYKRHNTREKWIPLDTHATWNKFRKKK